MNIVFELQYCMNLSLVCTEYDFAFYTYILELANWPIVAIRLRLGCVLVIMLRQ